MAGVDDHPRHRSRRRWSGMALACAGPLGVNLDRAEGHAASCDLVRRRHAHRPGFAVSVPAAWGGPDLHRRGDADAGSTGVLRAGYRCVRHDPVRHGGRAHHAPRRGARRVAAPPHHAVSRRLGRAPGRVHGVSDDRTGSDLGAARRGRPLAPGPGCARHGHAPEFQLSRQLPGPGDATHLRVVDAHGAPPGHLLDGLGPRHDGGLARPRGRARLEHTLVVAAARRPGLGADAARS